MVILNIIPKMKQDRTDVWALRVKCASAAVLVRGKRRCQRAPALGRP